MAIGCKIQKNWERPGKELMEELKKFPVANVDDCMFRTAAIHSAIRPLNRIGFCGPAFTVRVPEGDNLMLHKALDMLQPGDVLMIDAGGGETRAIFGELMATYAEMKGCAAMVVDGCVRDYDALSEMKTMAVYARGATPNGPFKNGPGEIGTVIQVGGRIVKPGDIVMGDADGVITIDPADAPAILEAVRAVEKKEAAIMETMKTEGTYIRPWVDEMLRQLGCEEV